MSGKTTVTAKFKVEEINQNANGKTIKLRPVYSQDVNSENGKFYKQTPGGEISLSTVNEEAAAQFEVGKEMYVDFRPAD